MFLDKVRMSRDYPYVESVTATFRSWNHSAEAIEPIVSTFLDARKIHRVGVAKRSVVRFADIGLNPNMCWIDRSEEDASDNLQFVADEHRRPARLRGFHRLNPDMRPVDTGRVLSLGQLYRRLAIVRAQGLKTLGSRFV